jgi:hypothetical protein
MGQAVDLYIVYEFIKRLATPFDETKAFELGLIDAKGKRLKYAKTKEEKDAMTLFDRLVLNLKRIISMVPGGSSKVGSYAAALLLIKEDENLEKKSDAELCEMLMTEMKNLKKSSLKDFKSIREDAPANATGAAVAGTGSDPVHWGKPAGIKGDRKKVGRSISGTQFLKRRMKKMANTDLRTL